MKDSFILKKGFCLFITVLILVFCSISAYAIDLDGDGIDDDEPVPTEYVEPETEYVEPETEYIEPETEYIEPTTEYAEPITEYIEPITEYVEPITEYIEPVTEDYYEPMETYPLDEYATEYQAPTMSKTVSSKVYSTNDMAGIISWACVGIGLLAVSIVMISTKFSGRL